MLPVDLMVYPTLGLVRLMVKDVVRVGPVDCTKDFCLMLGIVDGKGSLLE